MKIKDVRWAVVALTAILIMFLSACSAGAEEPLPDSGVTTLIYANLREDGPDREMIDRFNRTHTDIQIEVRDYVTENGRSGKDRLFAEMLAGQVPDIFDIGRSDSSSFATVLPYRVLAKKGYLEDLWPYIENDPALGRGGVLEAPLKAAEVDGGLYVVFSRVSINTLVGAEQIVGNRYSWTLEEMKETYAAMPEGSTILPFYYRRKNVLQTFVPMLLDSYVDWEAGQCSFDSEGFRAVLTFLNSFPEEVDILEDMDILAESAKRLANGQQMLEGAENVSIPRCVQFMDTYFGGRGSFIGFPVEDGSVGSSFFPGGQRLAISSTCKNKEAAWKFVRQLLLPKESQQTIGSLFSLPVNRADYNRLVRYSRSKDISMMFYRFGKNAPPIEIHPVTDEELERYEDFINSIDKIELCDETIYGIVKEVSEAYFAGDKSLDEAVQMIQNRVTLYVNENL